MVSRASILKRRFENSLDIVAARSHYIREFTCPSGMDSSSSTMDSPTLGRASSVMASREKAELEAAEEQVPAKPTSSVAPLNIKKARRRGVLSNAPPLILPPSPDFNVDSPVLGRLSRGRSPQTALTFTAEWDLTRKAFVLTPYDAYYPLSVDTPFSSNTQLPYTPFAVTPISPNMPRSSSPIPDVPEVDHLRSDSVDTELRDRADVRSSTQVMTGTPFFYNDSIYSSESSDADSILSRDRRSRSTAFSSIYEEPSPKPQHSTSSFSQQIALNQFGLDLQGYFQKTCSDSFDESLLEDLDEDVLQSPLGAFEQLCWQTTEEHSAPGEIKTLVRRGTMRRNKPLPNIPLGGRALPTSNEASKIQALDKLLNTRANLNDIEASFFSFRASGNSSSSPSAHTIPLSKS